jgi:hypothetical protein
VLILVRVGTLGWAQPLPVPFEGRDGGEVVHLSSAVGLRQEEGVVANPGLSVWLGLLGLAGPQSFMPSLAKILRATWPAN